MSKPKRYDPAAIETKWQSRWENEKTYACHVDKDKKKYYVLEMFPYPSGNLHMGHVRNYSIGDVVARFKRMQGFNVMHPMGWDAFGLPAENAAIKHNIHPSVWTHANIDNMRAQLKRLGYSYDWDREVATCDEPYYRWEQLFFLRWLEKGLVYRKKASQNWCPHCNTVLANEQVVDGLCWRCDTPVVQKELTQWFLKITDYADELLADLSKLEGGWPDRVLSMQRNWIGKSVGAEITFPLESGEGDIKVFTTRPDTVFGVTFMTLAPEHPLVESLISGKPNEAEARAFIERTHNMDRIDRQSDSLEKEGVFTGSYCLNPFTGRQVPIWLGNFVLAEYGTGAVMAVPAHDQRDFDFSKKYGMERIVVIQPEGEAPLTPENLTEAYTAPGVLVNSGEFDGLPNEDAKKAIADATTAAAKEVRLKEHLTVKKAGEDIGNRYQFNTAIAAIMELVNALYLAKDELATTEEGRKVLSSAMATVLTLLAPITPHVCEELWEDLGHARSIDQEPWPVWKEDALQRDVLTVVIQINGKLRGKIEVPASASKEEVEQLALTEQNIVRHLEGLTVRKVVVIPGKLVNVVAN